MRKLLAALMLIPSIAFAQSAVRQSGVVNKNDGVKWTQSGIVQSVGGLQGDNTGAGQNPFSVTDNGALGLCFNTALTNTTYHSFCFGHSGTNAIITVDGTSYTFPFTLSGIVGPGTTVAGNIATWGNTIGTLLADSGVSYKAVPRGTIIAWSPSTAAGPTVPVNFALPIGAPAFAGCATTHSECLNELFSYAATNSYAFEGNFQTYNGSSPAAGSLYSTVPVVIAASSFPSIHIHNLLLQITASDGLVIDSQEVGTISYDSGVILFTPTSGGATGSPIHILPQNPTPVDGTVGINLMHLTFPAVVAFNASQNAVINIDGTHGFLSRSELKVIGDICGGGSCNQAGFTSTYSSVGIKIQGFNGINGFSQNTIKIVGQIHQVSVAGVQEGTIDDFTHLYSGNNWDINSIDPTNASAIGFITYGSGDRARIGKINNDEGSFATCWKFVTANAFNNFFTGDCTGYGSSAIIDASGGTGGATNDYFLTNTTTSALVVAGPGRPAFFGALQTSQSVTSTVQAKVSLTAVLDANSLWNSSTHVWTPNVPGTYRACWGASATSASAMVLISAYATKNGAASGSTPAAQAAPINGTVSASATGCSIYFMNGTTDTLELDAVVIATTPQVYGASTSPQTYLSITREGP